MRLNQTNLKKICLATAVAGMSLGVVNSFESQAQSSSSSGSGGSGGYTQHGYWDNSTGVSILKCNSTGDNCRWVKDR